MLPVLGAGCEEDCSRRDDILRARTNHVESLVDQADILQTLVWEVPYREDELRQLHNSWIFEWFEHDLAPEEQSQLQVGRTH